MAAGCVLGEARFTREGETGKGGNHYSSYLHEQRDINLFDLATTLWG